MNERELRRRARSIRLVAADMDGTLLNDAKQLTDVTREAIRRLAASGRTFSFATGRLCPTLARYAGQLGVRCYMIGANGAEIVSTEGDVLHRACIPYEEFSVLAARCGANGIDYYCETAEGYYLRAGSSLSHIFDGYDPSMNAPKMPFSCHLLDHRPLEEIRPLQLLKVLVANDRPDMRALLAGLTADTPSIAVTQADPRMLEMIPAAASKGGALRQLAERLGIPRQQVCAFGDFDNDVGMVEWAGLGVAMGNARDCVKAVADWVTLSNEDNGVADFIDRYILSDTDEAL